MFKTGRFQVTERVTIMKWRHELMLSVVIGYNIVVLMIFMEIKGFSQCIAANKQ